MRLQEAPVTPLAGNEMYRTLGMAHEKFKAGIYQETALIVASSGGVCYVVETIFREGSYLPG